MKRSTKNDHYSNQYQAKAKMQEPKDYAEEHSLSALLEGREADFQREDEKPEGWSNLR